MIKSATFVSAFCLAAVASQVHPAFADEEDDKAFTEYLDSTSEECGKIAATPYKFLGKMNVSTSKLSVSGCSNISDGLRAVCGDNSAVDSAKANLKASLAKIKTVVCEYADPKAPTATVALKGNALHVWINIDMPDPSEKARCVIANALKLKYKGDLDAKCLERKH